MRKITQPSHRFRRRFMWKDMDDTMDNIYDGIASSAKALKHTLNNMLTLRGSRANHPAQYMTDYLLPQQSYVKYVYKKPLKHVKVIKVPAKKSNLKTTTTTTTYATPDDHKFTSEEQYFDKDKLRKLEIAEERRVEATMSSALKATEFYPNEIVSGHIKVSDDDNWAPVTGFTPSGFTTSKSYPVSELHTNIGGKKSNSNNKFTTYEVTEHSGEESANVQSTYKTVPTAKPSQATQRDYQGYYFRQNSKRQSLPPKNKTIIAKYKIPEATVTSDQSSFILKKPSTTTKTKNIAPVSELFEQISGLNIGSALTQETDDRQTTPKYQKLISDYTPKIRVKKNHQSRENRGSIKFGEKFLV